MKLYLQPDGITILTEYGGMADISAFEHELITNAGGTITTSDGITIIVNVGFFIPPDGFDSTKYKERGDDQAIRHAVGAGYQVTRPRFTRTPARTFQMGWTSIPDESKRLIEQKSIDTKTGALSFFILNKLDNEIINVRFAAPPEFDYVGIGIAKLWDVNASFVEV